MKGMSPLIEEGHNSSSNDKSALLLLPSLLLLLLPSLLLLLLLLLLPSLLLPSLLLLPGVGSPVGPGRLQGHPEGHGPQGPQQPGGLFKQLMCCHVTSR
jgi:hypothetical protein